MSGDDELHAFWDELILNDDGTPDMEAIYDELADYYRLMHHAGRVYYDITCGLISKTNTHSSDVISQANECAENIKREEVLGVLEDIRDGEMTLEEAIEEYSDDEL